MTDQRKIRFMKITCWIGIAADALWAIAFLFPGIYGLLISDPGFDPDIQSRISPGITASLMTGWTLLLVWAVQKPVERKEVMLFTALVTIGLFFTASANIYFGNTLFENVAWILFKILTMTIIFTTSYIFGKQLNQKT